MGSLAKQMSGQSQVKCYAKGGKVAPAKAVSVKAAKAGPKIATGSNAEIPAFMKKGGKCK